MAKLGGRVRLLTLVRLHCYAGGSWMCSRDRVNRVWAHGCWQGGYGAIVCPTGLWNERVFDDAVWLSQDGDEGVLMPSKAHQCLLECRPDIIDARRYDRGRG